MGYSLWGHKESDMTEQLSKAAGLVNLNRFVKCLVNLNRFVKCRTFQYASGHCESLGEAYNVHHFPNGFNHGII